MKLFLFLLGAFLISASWVDAQDRLIPRSRPAPVDFKKWDPKNFKVGEARPYVESTYTLLACRQRELGEQIESFKPSRECVGEMILNKKCLSEAQKALKAADGFKRFVDDSVSLRKTLDRLQGPPTEGESRLMRALRKAKDLQDHATMIGKDGQDDTVSFSKVLEIFTNLQDTPSTKEIVKALDAQHSEDIFRLLENINHAASNQLADLTLVSLRDLAVSCFEKAGKRMLDSGDDSEEQRFEYYKSLASALQMLVAARAFASASAVSEHLQAEISAAQLTPDEQKYCERVIEAEAIDELLLAVEIVRRDLADLPQQTPFGGLLKAEFAERLTKSLELAAELEPKMGEMRLIPRTGAANDGIR